MSQAVLDARETTFNTTKARLEQARAQAQVARNQSSYTTLVAEADGVITAVNVEAGQVVSAGQPVMRFARPEEKEVAINVPETRLGELRDASEILIASGRRPTSRTAAAYARSRPTPIRRPARSRRRSRSSSRTRR